MTPIITSIRNFEALANAVRSGKACIPITELKGGDASIPDPYFGSLVVEGDEAEFRLRSLSDDVVRTDPKSLGIIRRVPKFPELKCVLDGHLHVSVTDANSNFESRSSETGSTHRYSFSEISRTGQANPSKEASNIRIIAKIARSKLHFANLVISTKTACSMEGEIEDHWKHDGLGGEVHPYRYKIRQDAEDLFIEVKLADGATSHSTDDDRAFFSALILTFVWLNGEHPYAYYRSHERDDELVESAIQPLLQMPRCRARVISSSHCTDKAAAIIDCGIKFFQTRSPVACDLRDLIWQYRDATADASISLGMLLQGCSLLEGLVGTILHHPMQLEKSKIEKLRTPTQPSSDKRIGHAEARFYHAGDHLGFNWVTELQPVFETWKQVRNALAHGDLSKFRTSSQINVLDSYRQVIQAFNAISLRLIGYQGKVSMDNGWYAAPH